MKNQELPISDFWILSTTDTEAWNYQRLLISGELFPIHLLCHQELVCADPKAKSGREIESEFKQPQK